MNDIDEQLPSESRALAFLRGRAAIGDSKRRHVLDYVYDHRHMRRVRNVLRAEGITVRFGIHERGIWARIVSCPRVTK